jgi:hypothetical protein
MLLWCITSWTESSLKGQCANHKSHIVILPATNKGWSICGCMGVHHTDIHRHWDMWPAHSLNLRLYDGLLSVDKLKFILNRMNIYSSILIFSVSCKNYIIFFILVGMWQTALTIWRKLTSYQLIKSRIYHSILKWYTCTYTLDFHYGHNLYTKCWSIL